MSWRTVDPATPGAFPPNIQAILKRPATGAATLGQRLLEIDSEAGNARVAYDVGDHLLNRFGALHGGMTAAMMDDVMSIAAGLTLQWGEISPTLEMKVSYISMAKPGRLTGEARIVKRGRSVMFLEATLKDEAGALIATASATCSVIQNKKS
ncbi:MAG: PaaI family thioesterase [Alphaproteobacteria bacterium]|nr:PaaI family thioesterase [Alphaproteobacteria bacterium]